MKNVILNLLLFSVLLVSFTIPAQTQVTIGCGLAPNEGALLDLKQYADGTSTKGIILPRVTLTDVNDLTALGITIPTGYEGLMVYHLANSETTCKDMPSGLYVWTGNSTDNYWQILSAQNDELAADIYMDYDQEGIPFYFQEFGAAGYWMLTSVSAISYSSRVASAPALTHRNGSIVSSENAYWEYPIDNSVVDHSLLDKKPQIGLLYNWYAATGKQNMTTTEVDQGENGANVLVSGEQIQGICPDGWWLPSDVEFNQLESEIYNNPTKYNHAQENYSPTTWQTNWNTAMDSNRGSTPRGKDDAGHGRAMRHACDKGMSFSAQLGGFDFYMAGSIDGAQENGDYKIHTNSLLWTAARNAQDAGEDVALTRTISETDHNTLGRTNYKTTVSYGSVRCVSTNPFKRY